MPVSKRLRPRLGTIDIAGPKSNPVWRLRHYVTVVEDGRAVRKRKRTVLGNLSSMTREQAQAAAFKVAEVEAKKARIGAAFLSRTPASVAHSYEGSSQTVGAFCELMVCADLLRRGFEVYKAVNHFSKADLIAEKDGVYFAVEVKSSSEERLHRHRIARQAGRFDILVTVGKDGRVSYFVSSERATLIAADIAGGEV